MYHTNPITFTSVMKDIPARKLQDNILQTGENIIFDNGVIKTRYGLASIGGSSLPLSDKITGVSLYKKLRVTDRYLIAFTCRDIYVLNKKNNKWELKTRNHSSGLISSSGTGNRIITLQDTVLCTGTLFNGSDRITINSVSGVSPDMSITGDGIPDNTSILAISGTQLTLSNKCSRKMTPAGILTINSNIISSLSSTSGLAAGMPITGDNIPEGATITAIGTGSITLNKKAYSDTAVTGNITSGSNLITGINNLTGIKEDQLITGTGIPANTTILSKNGNTLQLSNNASATTTALALTITDVKTTTLSSPAFALAGVPIIIAWMLWKNSEWTQQGLYQISFDSSTLESCNTWYTVDKITSNKQLTLTVDLPAAKTNSVYCLRLCYAGDEDDAWNACYPYSDYANDRIILVTNSGIDAIQKWDGTGYFKDFKNYSNRAKYVGFFGSVGYEHVVFANIYDTGSGKIFEQTIEWCEAGGGLVFNGAYAELLDSTEPIVGIVPFGSRLFIYKSGSISIGDPNPNGGNENPFYITQNAVEYGTPSIRTVCNTGKYHVFFSGNDIRMFDGHNYDLLSEGNSQFIVNNINREYQHRSFAFIIPEQNLYCLFLPFKPSQNCNVCIVFNYLTGSWTYWTLQDSDGNTLYPLSKGKYNRTYAPRWCDLYAKPTGDLASGSNQITNLSSMANIVPGMKVVGEGVQNESYIISINGSTVTLAPGKNATATANGVPLKIGYTASQMNQRWSDLISDERYTRIIFGDTTGNLYDFAMDYNTDNDHSIKSSFITKDYDLNKAGYDFRMLECTLAMQLKDNFSPATIEVRASVDFSRNWSAWITVPLDGLDTYMEKKVNFNMVGKQVRFEIRMSNPLIFESMNIGFNAQYNSMKFDN